MFLNKDEILKAEDLPHEDAEVPEWGGTVRVRTMTGTERDAFEASVVTKDGKANFKNLRSKLLCKTLIDDKGNRLFSDSEEDALGKKSAAVLDRLFAIAQKLNGLGAKDLEDLEKNSGNIPKDAGTSGLPAN